ncbi:hypothetical protein [Hymenobacter yonginensis]|uniref:Uncharacterized protein n=1 Tax=Hymenobacter yonginensis TaxID=748197 RepID=A0ABY7PRE7_9BACT|nr:hypothetical protein [Hymenobacter yonginensis]WBO85429.1 hypothetical protein O9Z63_04105 [Hymenobacter yonginensis]
MRLLLSFILSLCFVQHPVIAQEAPVRGDTIALQYSLPQANCASFPADAKPRLDHQELLKGTKRFTPSKAQLVSAEEQLAKVDLGRVNNQPLNSYYADYPTIIKNQLAKYRRQYYGFHNAEGHPCLFINLFIYDVEEPSGQTPRWLRELQWFYDGGPALWSVLYDLKTQRFYDLHYNLEG